LSDAESSAAPAAQTERRAVVLTVAYDGGPYHGFALQREPCTTVASELLAAARHFDAGIEKLVVASRTDAGVHARMQLTAFDTTHTMPARAWVLGMQQRLPRSIGIRRAAITSAGYNPRFETKGKRYRYLLLHDTRVAPLWHGRAWRIGDLPADAPSRIENELASALGEHDFAGFSSARDKREHTTRTLSVLSAKRLPGDERVIAIDVAGDHFLHNMVRILVGTAVDVARGRLTPGAMARTLQSKDRRDAGITAPAHGLYLEHIALRAPITGETWPSHSDASAR